VSIHRNAPGEAERLVKKGIAAQPNRVDRLPLTALSIALVRALTDRRRLAQARRELDALRAAIAEWEPPGFLMRWLGVAEAELDLAGGDTARAKALDLCTDSGSLADQERVCKARALIADGEMDLAEQVVAPLREWSTDRGAEVEAWLVTAIVADHAREDHRATRAAQQALVLARHQDFRRPFTLFDQTLVARLIERAATLDPALTGFADEVLADVSYHDRSPAAGLAAPLTDRELMVLQHLPTMLNNAEIAAEMYLSVNTVKAHVKSLYRKLDVSSRRAAVERARALDLLTPGSESPR
jgi:LuxR family maltose regulon positive regulatory protein